MNFLRRLSFLIWYFRKPPWDTNVSPPELLAFIAEHPPGRALDLGCGTGTNVITLAQHGWKATGVDFVGRAIRQARRKARRAGVKASFFVDDVVRLERISGQFDLILDMGCFHSLSSAEMQDYADNIERLLAAGGSFLLYAFYQPPHDHSHSGVSPTDLALFTKFSDLVHQEIGSERGQRPSIWATFWRPV